MIGFVKGFAPMRILFPGIICGGIFRNAKGKQCLEIQQSNTNYVRSEDYKSILHASHSVEDS